MKKIFALVMALALLVSAFAATEVPATLSVTNPVFEGSVGFEVGFDENGLDLNFTKDLAVTTTFDWKYSAAVNGKTEGMLTVALSGDLGTPGATALNISLDSITYEDSMIKALFNNGGMLDYSTYILYNTYDSDGNAQLPAVGDRYALVTLKNLDAEVLYVDLTSGYDVNADATSVDNPTMLNGDLLAAKKSLSVSMIDANVTAAFWSADSTRLAVAGPATKTGFAVSAETTGKDAIAGLTADLFFGSYDGSSAYLLSTSYSKDFESGIFTVTPHMTFDYAVSATLPEFIKPVSDASDVTFGADLASDFGIAGSLTLTDTVTLPLAGDMTYTYAVEYSNKIHDLFNIESVKVSKADGSEIASPLELSAKVSGSTTLDAVSAGYDVTLGSVALDKVSDEYAVDIHANAGYEADMVSVSFDTWYKLHAATKDATNNLGYMASVSVKPMDKVAVDLSLKNFSGDTNSDGNYFDETFNEPADFLYSADVTYTPNDVITAGLHLSNATFGGKAFYWNAYVKGSMNF
ncbi:hypothetical protein [Marinitoga aeolica]|uniref:Uncharacterized protein n=1 Tax=Marinitoga aeolica TaxID=2809031 RepID=A0ABY8PND0_9BACT|nr:hypothetical protein [Marinitoga aeolica]WGS64147.1 hypothetical protein JRV97_07125 [Marinitoga aeolica]